MNSRAKILVVDDEPLVLRAIAMVLRHLGHRVEMAPDGRSALDLFAQSQFDLVITDLSIPDIRGDELAARIRQQVPTQKIIIVTAFAEVYRKTGQIAVDCILDKPFTLAALTSAVDSALTGHKTD